MSLEGGERLPATREGLQEALTMGARYVEETAALVAADTHPADLHALEHLAKLKAAVDSYIEALQHVIALDLAERARDN